MSHRRLSSNFTLASHVSNTLSTATRSSMSSESTQQQQAVLADQTKDEPLVLLLGARFIQLGIAGQSRPLVTVETCDYSGKQSFTAEPGRGMHSSRPEQIEEMARLQVSTSQMTQDLQEFRFLFYPDLLAYQDSSRLVESFDYGFRNHIYRILEDLFKRIQFNSVNSKVYLIEGGDFSNEMYQLQVADVLLTPLQARSVVFLPGPVMTVLAAGTPHALVVDCDWNTASVTPVYDYRILQNYCKVTNEAARAVHYTAIYKLRSAGISIPAENSFRVIEKLIEHSATCKDGADGFEGSAIMEIGGQTLVLRKSWIYEAIQEHMFPEENNNFDSDNKSISCLIAEALSEIPVDVRKEVAAHIIVTGSLSLVPGFGKKIALEASKLLNNDNIVLDAESIHSLGAWAGASLYTSTVLPKQRNNTTLREFRRD